MSRAGGAVGRWGGWLLATPVLALLIVGCGRERADVIEASGTVEVTEADLGFQIAGRIDSVLVVEGARVARGARLAMLDRRELAARVAAARAQADQQRARLRELRRGFRPEEIAQARASLRAAEPRVADAIRDRQRARNLFAGGAISRQALDQAETAVTIAEAERDRMEDQLRLLTEGPRREQIEAQEAVLAQSEALLTQAEVLLGFAEITAPFDGIVSRRHREPGEVVSAGLPVITLQNLEDRWVRIYLRADLMGRLRPGRAAEIRIDAFPGRVYQGEVAFIADEAEFTPRNVQTREERVRLVYRVKVRVVSDTALDLKPGLPADVRLPD